MGTPLYMSPEQVNGRKLDARTDIYSFGVTVYHMLAGRPPFRGETAMSVAAQHLKDEPASLQQRRADLPPALTHLIHQMLEKDPAARQQSAAELLTQIETLADELGTRTVRFRLEDTRTNPILRQLTSGNFARILTVCCVVGLVSGVLGYVLRPVEPFEFNRVVGTTAFPQQESAAQQFVLALREDNEHAWQAVIDYFPNSLEAKRALAQLGAFYMFRDRYDDAREQYNQLVSLGSSDLQLKAKGLVGLARLAAGEGQLDRAREIVDVELLDLRDKIKPGTLEFDLLQETRELLDGRSDVS